MEGDYVRMTISNGIARMQRDKQVMDEQFERLSPMDATTISAEHADTSTDQSIAKWQAKLDSMPPDDLANHVSLDQ